MPRSIKPGTGTAPERGDEKSPDSEADRDRQEVGGTVAAFIDACRRSGHCAQALVELVPLQKTNKDEITTQYSMKDLESIGLLKMDFLALTTLTVIDNAVRRIREEKGIDLDLASHSVDGSEVFELFSEGKTNGMFQFESGGMKTELRRLKPERFEDLIALNALYRPGPMDMIPDFIKRKQGLIEVRYPHPVLEEILKETYGVIVYQEQVMQIASKMAGFSLGEADILRKAMGKKLASVMVSMREKFIDGAQERNCRKGGHPGIRSHGAVCPVRIQQIA